MSNMMADRLKVKLFNRTFISGQKNYFMYPFNTKHGMLDLPGKNIKFISVPDRESYFKI